MSDDYDWDDEEFDDEEYDESPWGLFYQGYNIRHQDADAGLAKMVQARDAALEAGDLRSTFEMNHWILQTLIYNKQDFTAAYELAVKTAAESSNPIYDQMQERICVYQDLILAHMGIDPLGYADLIEQAIHEMNRRITGPVQCRMCMQDIRCTFEIVQGNLPAAEQATNQYLALVDDATWDRPYHRVAATSRMAEIAFMRGDWQRMIDFAQQGLRAARGIDNRQEYPPFFEACLALAHRKLGSEDAARKHYRTAANLAGAHLPNEISAYYTVLCAYHEAEGDLREAVNLRDRELEEINGRGQIYREAYIHLDKARLLKEMGQPFAEPLAKAEALIARLKRPDVLAEQVNALKG